MRSSTLPVGCLPHCPSLTLLRKKQLRLQPTLTQKTHKSSQYTSLHEKLIQNTLFWLRISYKQVEQNRARAAEILHHSVPARTNNTGASRSVSCRHMCQVKTNQFCRIRTSKGWLETLCVNMFTKHTFSFTFLNRDCLLRALKSSVNSINNKGCVLHWCILCWGGIS